MQTIELSEKIMETLDAIPSYTANAALEICQSLIRERDTRTACLQFSQGLSKLSALRELSHSEAEPAQFETSSAR